MEWSPKKICGPGTYPKCVFCKKPDSDWSTLASGRLFIKFRSIQGVPTLHSVSSPRYQRETECSNALFGTPRQTPFLTEQFSKMSIVVVCLWVALATTVSRSRERLKKLPWVPPRDFYQCFQHWRRTCGFKTRQNQVILVLLPSSSFLVSVPWRPPMVSG